MEKARRIHENVVHNNNSEMLYFGNMADWKWKCDNKPGFCTPTQWGACMSFNTIMI